MFELVGEKFRNRKGKTLNSAQTSTRPIVSRGPTLSLARGQPARQAQHPLPQPSKPRQHSLSLPPMPRAHLSALSSPLSFLPAPELLCSLDHHSPPSSPLRRGPAGLAGLPASLTRASSPLLEDSSPEPGNHKEKRPGPFSPHGAFLAAILVGFQSAARLSRITAGP